MTSKTGRSSARHLRKGAATLCLAGAGLLAGGGIAAAAGTSRPASASRVAHSVVAPRRVVAASYRGEPLGTGLLRDSGPQIGAANGSRSHSRTGGASPTSREGVLAINAGRINVNVNGVAGNGYSSTASGASGSNSEFNGTQAGLNGGGFERSAAIRRSLARIRADAGYVRTSRP